MDKSYILHTYPWLYDNTPKQVIMGDDLDAVLSTVLYLKNNPNAQLVGIYTGYSTLFFNPDVDPSNCIYIDLDIYHHKCRSLGHHIVRINDSDALTGFSNSCNLNELAGRSLSRNFEQKYPLGTVHFLMWLYNTDLPQLRFAEPLVWLVDSSFINGQSHRFRKNMGNWIYNLMPSETLKQGFYAIDTPEFEFEVEALQNYLKECGLNKGFGQVHSRFMKLSGFQGQPSNKARSEDLLEWIGRMLQIVALLMDWQVPLNQINMADLSGVIEGKRGSNSVVSLLDYGQLDLFLEERQVFSYVFPFKSSINLTRSVDI